MDTLISNTIIRITFNLYEKKYMLSETHLLKYCD